MKLKKYIHNPIIYPSLLNQWESLVTTNPAAWYEDGVFYLLYRAAGRDREHKIYFGLAKSTDGFHFERCFDHPVLGPSLDGPDSGCIEDPRIVKFDDDFYITYAYRPFPPGQYWNFEYDQVIAPPSGDHAPLCIRHNIANTGLLQSKDLITFRRLGRITQSHLDDRDVILFPEIINGRYYRLHRPKEWVGEAYGTSEAAVWITSSHDLMVWENESRLLLKGEQDWEQKVGGNAPPIRTDKGWLMLYHGVDDQKTYRFGACLLDLNHPEVVTHRSPHWIMEPETPFEMNGLYKWGCVFSTGNVVVGNELFVYYGAADMYCCVATCPLNELIDYLLENPVNR